jgi:dUTP pyrophosphatase
MVSIKCRARDGAALPVYQTEGASGADVRACLGEPATIPAGGRLLVPTGLTFEIPAGYEVQVRPRSGLALKHGVTCLNAPGTVDSDYRGELCVLLVNHGREPFTVHNGDRVAQLVVSPVARAGFAPAASLAESGRGAGGFGSTGLGGE